MAPALSRAERCHTLPRLAVKPPAAPLSDDTLLQALREAVEPLPAFDDPAFAQSFDRYGSCRIVMLGEASHGTSEFYRARAAITRRLIDQHGFSLVAVEADWPDASAIDHHVRLLPARSTPAQALAGPQPGCGATAMSTTSSASCVTTIRGNRRTDE